MCIAHRVLGARCAAAGCHCHAPHHHARRDRWRGLDIHLPSGAVERGACGARLGSCVVRLNLLTSCAALTCAPPSLPCALLLARGADEHLHSETSGRATTTQSLKLKTVLHAKPRVADRVRDSATQNTGTCMSRTGSSSCRVWVGVFVKNINISDL